MKKRRYTKDELAHRGDEIYEKQVAPNLNATDEGRFVAIDVQSGEYEIGDDELQACDKLAARIRDAQTWLVRIGSRYLHRFGGRETRRTS